MLVYQIVNLKLLIEILHWLVRTSPCDKTLALCSGRTISRENDHAQIFHEHLWIFRPSLLCGQWQAKSVQKLGRLNFYFSFYMGVSKNRGTPKSSILIGFSIINHPFWGTFIFGNTHMLSIHYFANNKEWIEQKLCVTRCEPSDSPPNKSPSQVESANFPPEKVEDFSCWRLFCLFILWWKNISVPWSKVAKNWGWETSHL